MKLAIAGCSGRMGEALVRIARESQDVRLAVLGVRAMHDAPSYVQGLNVSANSEDLFSQADAVIDFTSPEHSLALAKLAAASGKVHIVGTTGFNHDQMKELQALAHKSRTVWSANMSMGVNILARLVQQTASLLGEEFDIEILEMHHNKKKDAPSGTALMLGRSAALGREVDFDSHKILTRDGITGERKEGTIGFATLRGGDVVGDHTAMFAGPAEIISLSHRAHSRDIYARGAIRAALWAQGKQPGFYSMQDVLFGR